MSCQCDKGDFSRLIRLKDDLSLPGRKRIKGWAGCAWKYGRLRGSSEHRWAPGRAAAPEEFRSIRFIAGQADIFVIGSKKVCQINGFFICRTRTAAEEQQLFLLQEFTFDKEFVVGGVALIH